MEHEVHIFTKGSARKNILIKDCYDTGSVSLMTSFNQNGKIYKYDYLCKRHDSVLLPYNQIITGELDAVCDAITICDMVAKDEGISRIIVHHRQPGVKYYADGTWNTYGDKSNHIIRAYKVFLEFWVEGHNYDIGFMQRSGEFKELETFMTKHVQNALDGRIYDIYDEEDYVKELLEIWWRVYR